MKYVCSVTPGMELSPTVHPGVRIAGSLRSTLQRPTGTDPGGTVFLGEAVKLVIQELREKQREPWELEQTLKCLMVHDIVARAALWFLENGG